jgi:glutamine amidotransferase
MCRLIAYVGPPVTPGHLVFDGTHSLCEQTWGSRQLLTGTLNVDGYGVVWYADGCPARIAEPRPLWHDEDLRSTLSAITSSCVLAAVSDSRRAGALPRALLPPLVLDRWSFVFAGEVPGFQRDHMRALRSDLPDELYAQLRGPTEGETLFLRVIAELGRGRSMVEALEAVARAVKARLGKSEAQLNMVLSDGQRLAAIRSSTVLMTNSLYVAKRPPFAPDGVVLVSEAPESGAAWEAVDGHSFIEIEADGSVRADLLLI